MKKIGWFILAIPLFVACKKGKTMNEDSLFFDQQEVAEYVKREKQIQSIQIPGFDHAPMAQDFYKRAKVNDKLTKSAFFFRKNSLLLPLRTQYYFTETDSLVKFIKYEWNVVTPEMTAEQINQTTANLNKYRDSYGKKWNDVIYQLREKFGHEIEGEPKLQVEKTLNLERGYSTMIWQKDNVVAELHISLIPTISFRIYCKVYWLEENLLKEKETVTF